MATLGERVVVNVSAPAGLETKKDGVEERARGRTGMLVPRDFSTDGTRPFDLVDWESRTAEIKDEGGQVIFQQVGCEVPRTWSQLATNVVLSEYFYGDVASGNGSPAEGRREDSVR